MDTETQFFALLQTIVEKLTSARFLATMIVIITLCWAVKDSLDMAMKAVGDEKTFSLIKEIIMFVLGAFVSVVTAITTSYFLRPDRNGQETREVIDPLNK